MKTTSFTKPLIAAFLVATTTAVCVAADLDRSDKEFIKDTYENGLAEVKMGEMAGAKSAHADVKAFATTMVTDHGKANTELKALADAKKVEVATDLTVVAKGKVKLLDAKSGAAFDKAFAEDMVSAHKKAVSSFEKAANEAKDADVKAFAAKVLPTLKMHLSMAEDIHNKVGK